MRVAAVICFIFFGTLLSGCSKGTTTTSENAIAKETTTALITDADIISEKPKIIAYGDSLTSGFGIADANKFYPSLLQKRLEHEGYDHQVLNFGVPGDTVEGGLNRLPLALRNENIRIFILELGANDIIKKRPASQIGPVLQQIIDRVKQSGAKIVLCGYVPPSSFGGEYVREIREMNEKLAEKNGLPLIPDFMEGVRGDKERMQPDEIHPNEKGAEVIEQNVWPVVKTLLAKNDDRQKK